MKNSNSLFRNTLRRAPLMAAALLPAVAGSVVFSLLPPLVLERIVDALAGGEEVKLSLILGYFLFVALTGLFDAGKEALITSLGQKLTHSLRTAMCRKLSRLPAAFFTAHQPGEVASCFVNDVETVEVLFSSGLVGMATDICRVVGILAVIFRKSVGLGVLLMAILPLLFLFTRRVQKKMLQAQKENRAAVARVNAYVPETIRNMRMLRLLGKERYMEKKYAARIEAGYRATEKSNFFDAVYSPVILLTSAAVVAVMMLLAASGGAAQTLFGISVGGAVAVIAYVGRVFEPLESIGMEIQSVQSAVAGVKRIREFLALAQREETDASLTAQELLAYPGQAVSASGLSFGYGDVPVLKEKSFTVKRGESVLLAGRTGDGKSTVLKLLLGFYRPQCGTLLVLGTPADKIPDSEKRRLFGVVEQNFRPVPGTVLQQITVFDPSISRGQAEQAAELADLAEEIRALPQGFDTPYRDELFSQGQRQKLAIARAVAGNPEILLLDEITANLDADTEDRLMKALRKAGDHRTVIAVSHRLYREAGGRVIPI